MKTSSAGIMLGLLAGVVCGASAGYWLGRQNSASFPTAVVARAMTSSQPLESAASGGASREDATTAASAANLAPAKVNIADQFAELLKIDSPLTRAYKLEELFATMTAEEAPGIFAEILALPNARDRSKLVSPFFKQWGKVDGPAAVAKANELVGRDKRVAMISGMAGWAEIDPFAAWATAKEQVPGASPANTMKFSGVVSELAKRDLRAAFDAYAIADNRWSQETMRYSILQAALDTDQVSALLSMARNLGDAQDREEWISNIFGRWGEADSDAPLEALRGISDPGLAKKAMEGFLQGWMQADPAGAADYVIANHADPMVTDSFGSLLGSAFNQGTRKENYDLAAHIAEAGLLDQAAPRMVSAVAVSDPELALHLASLVSDRDTSETLTQNAIANWAFNQFDAASEYINRMPASELKTKTIGVVAWSAMQREGGGARIAAWMQDVPTGKQRTKVVEQLLASATSPYAELKPDFLATLKGIVAGESGLSEDALKQRDRLFGTTAAAPVP